MDAEWVAAAAAVASVLVAIGALVTAHRSGQRSEKAELQANRARDGIGRVQAAMSKHLGDIAQAQVAQVQQQQGVPGVGGRGGKLSARLLGNSGSEQLRVENTGDELLEVVDLQVLKQPEVMAEGNQGDPRGVQLEPGEHTSVLLGLSIANTLPLEVLMRWRDSRGVQERIQHVSYERVGRG